MFDMTWDILKIGATIVVGTYAMGMLILALVGVSTIIFSLIVIGLFKLAEGMQHVIKRLFNRKFPKSKIE